MSKCIKIAVFTFFTAFVLFFVCGKSHAIPREDFYDFSGRCVGSVLKGNNGKPKLVQYKPKPKPPAKKPAPPKTKPPASKPKPQTVTINEAKLDRMIKERVEKAVAEQTKKTTGSVIMATAVGGIVGSGACAAGGAVLGALVDREVLRLEWHWEPLEAL